MWGELLCRRDYGYVFESNGRWTYAKQFYEISFCRSELNQGSWTRKHERLTPRQGITGEPMPFWTNADDGYVTGSLVDYALGRELIVAGKFGPALTWLEQAVAACPDFAVCWTRSRPSLSRFPATIFRLAVLCECYKLDKRVQL
jgi:hypothetical protein